MQRPTEMLDHSDNERKTRVLDAARAATTIASMPSPSTEFNEALEKRANPTMVWKNTNEFDCDATLVVKEIYKGHEISIATDHRGHHPGIKVYGAPNNEIQKPGSKVVDLTDCFSGVDAGEEIPFSLTAIRDIMDQVDAWEMNNRAMGEEMQKPLEKVMLVRCMQALVERFLQQEAIDPAWANYAGVYIDRLLADGPVEKNPGPNTF
jgi:hypothetical protein